MDLIAAINELGKKVKKTYPHINHGGCCTFAAFAASRLRKHGRVRILVGGEIDLDDYDAEPPQSLDEVRELVSSNTVREWNRQGVYFAHVIVEFRHNKKTYHYDTTGAHPPAERTNMGGYDIMPGHLGVREAKQLALSSGWNPSFDPCLIPRVRRMIDEAFDKIDQKVVLAT
jgi:hypothetical protein